MLEIIKQLGESRIRVGAVSVRNVSVGPSPDALREELKQLINERKGKEFSAEIKAAVRDMLRTPAFKPTGRSKPASEYLLQAAQEDRFPFINNLVDVNNYISLISGLPASLLDLDVTGERIVLRHGLPGEKYVFNEGGQEIELNGLACICRADPAPGHPLGTPVKDSMEGKLKPHSRNVVGLVLAPSSVPLPVELPALMSKFGEMISRYGGGQVEGERVV